MTWADRLFQPPADLLVATFFAASFAVDRRWSRGAR